MLHLIVGKITNDPTVIMPKTDKHNPGQTTYPWWIKDADTGEIVRQYVPVRKPKQTVDTPRHNAWYQNNAINFKVGHIC
jgi:hypothetical protein